MQKIHVSETYNSEIEPVFNAISDHANFLSGGGLSCTILKPGKIDPNGMGAIRQVVSKSLTLDEEIVEFEKNKCFAYVIISTKPKKPLFHKKGWLEFHYKDGITTVDWHSHFSISIPVVGGLIGWFSKKQMAKVFENRLKYIKQDLFS